MTAKSISVENCWPAGGLNVVGTKSWSLGIGATGHHVFNLIYVINAMH